MSGRDPSTYTLRACGGGASPIRGRRAPSGAALMSSSSFIGSSLRQRYLGQVQAVGAGRRPLRPAIRAPAAKPILITAARLCAGSQLAEVRHPRSDERLADIELD